MTADKKVCRVCKVCIRACRPATMLRDAAYFFSESMHGPEKCAQPYSSAIGVAACHTSGGPRCVHARVTKNLPDIKWITNPNREALAKRKHIVVQR